MTEEAGAEVHLALLTEAGEVTGAGYARQPARLRPHDDGTLRLVETVAFGPTREPWGTIVGARFMTGPDGPERAVWKGKELPAVRFCAPKFLGASWASNPHDTLRGDRATIRAEDLVVWLGRAPPRIPDCGGLSP